MKIFVEVPPDLSRAMARVSQALKAYLPSGIQVVAHPDDADVVFLHVIGYPETADAVTSLIDRGQEYVIIQYCMRSTQQPDTTGWRKIWRNARLVWSYYDLHKLTDQDGWTLDFFFHQSPLGVDEIFRHTDPYAVKLYTALTSGYVAESESVTEIANAVQKVDGRHFHLGPRTVAPNSTMSGEGISDRVLAEVYARTCWVSGLRRTEGFEMPAAEGLCSGARPILFDAPHYRNWYDPWGEFIPEGTPAEVEASILRIFERGFTPMSSEQIADAREFFRWERIMDGFWKEFV